ncbi:TPA: hypothetical protein DEX28_01970 [Patescibacteria group bacterium]|nr:MAG: hypothetical protein UW85_C0001G0059 [Parcubacteria group bacterium GW2011_GWA1_Parcubacteria_45_10]KKT89278.1 MAG: hypothetical protein UW89_C0001G0006 [Parcubacteria group bacterium GW2011_GWB1_45_10]HCI05490.1 hypothetical protein [Patescibacteria group bacterium]
MEHRNFEEFVSYAGYLINGKWYPRVTSIISIKAKPALLRFYGEAKNYSAAQSITDKSATQGTKIHNAIEAILKNEALTVDPEIKPAVQAFNDFAQLHKLRLDGGAIEKRIWSPKHCFAGTVDVLAELDDEFGVLDIKTSSGIWRDYNLQTAAYLGALQEDEPWEGIPKKELKSRWILRLDQQQSCLICGAKKRNKGGNAKIRGGIQSCFHEWSDEVGEWELKKLDNFESDFEAFLAAKRLWEWENENYLKQLNYF